MRTEKTAVRAAASAHGEGLANGSGQSQGDAVGVIEQVRELLFGETKRSSEHGLKALEDKVEALTALMHARFSEMEGRVADVGQEAERAQASAFDEIGGAIAHLGATIRNMGGARRAK